MKKMISTNTTTIILFSILLTSCNTTEQKELMKPIPMGNTISVEDKTLRELTEKEYTWTNQLMPEKIAELNLYSAKYQYIEEIYNKISLAVILTEADDWMSSFLVTFSKDDSTLIDHEVVANYFGDGYRKNENTFIIFEEETITKRLEKNKYKI